MTMEHPSVDDLSAFLDGELAPEEQSSVDLHVAGCGSCTTILDRFRGVRDLLAALPRPVPDDEDRAAWRGAVEREVRGATVTPIAPRRRHALPWAVAAAVALLVAVGFPLLRRSSPPTASGPTVDAASSLPALAQPTVACTPTAASDPTSLRGTDDVEGVLRQAAPACGPEVRRSDVGRHQTEYVQRLSSSLPGLESCMKALHEQVQAPLLPVFAAPATYQDQAATLVVFLTTFSEPAKADDPLDSRQAWVLSNPGCSPLAGVTA